MRGVKSRALRALIFSHGGQQKPLCGAGNQHKRFLNAGKEEPRRSAPRIGGRGRKVGLRPRDREDFRGRNGNQGSSQTYSAKAFPIRLPSGFGCIPLSFFVVASILEIQTGIAVPASSETMTCISL